MQPGYEIRAINLPSPTKPAGEPVRVSVFDDSGVHKVTVTGTRRASTCQARRRPRSASRHRFWATATRLQDNSLYSSLHFTASKQGVPNDLILQIMRIHAYDDRLPPAGAGRRRRRVLLRHEGRGQGIDGEIGDLLATFVTAGGATAQVLPLPRPATASTDFYDAEGSTSRKFLMRRPVRGEDVRLTSGFGPRRHPLL